MLWLLRVPRRLKYPDLGRRKSEVNRILSIQSIRLKKQRILIRVDFNVPLHDGTVSDNFRIQAALPTIQYCLNEGSSVVLMSHLGRPEGKKVEELSLLPVGEVLSDLLEKSIKFSEDCISNEAITVSQNLLPGEVHLLENLRFHKGETENDPFFSQKLSQHGTTYVNDAFGTAHRAHASNVGVVNYFREKAIGLLMEKEFTYFHQILQEPKRPLVIILGGAKIGTKLGIIHRFLQEADSIIIGGGMAFTFLKAKRYMVGQSLVEENLIETATAILNQSKKLQIPIYLPLDFVVTHDVKSGRPSGEKDINQFTEGEIGVDIGKKTVQLFRKIIGKSQTVVWNGPMGIFETPDFRNGTSEIARSVAELTNREGVSIIGGGDSAAAIKLFGLENFMSHISTGGGASLELLAGNKLPAFSTIEGS